ncbi:MAG: crossover junction endodeoxyribonuclease RuvC [Cytophagaceae bacterium]|jgi:crossover junction endodeoxyribonuclease RuvC|nr:crossover junction endodeoxyribonuclease RuvC [Cytophagaceae bacterium]
MAKTSPITAERILLGVDPGTTVMGYGIIAVEKKKLILVQYGVIHLSKYSSHALKLSKIYERMVQLIDEFHPDEMAIEAPFYGKNIQSMLKLGRAQGVAIAAAISRQVPIVEYAPKKVKQAVTGNGNASKEQVAAMLQRLLGFSDERQNRLLDATDALGVALCHYLNKGENKKASKGWATFLEENKDRVKNK